MRGRHSHEDPEMLAASSAPSPPPPSHEHMTPEKYPLQECSLLPSNYLTDKFTSVSRERQAGCRILPVTGKAGEIKGSADGRATETGRGQGTRRP